MELTACTVYSCCRVFLYSVSYQFRLANKPYTCVWSVFLFLIKNMIKLQLILVAGKDIMPKIYQVVLNVDPQVTSASI